MIAALIPDEIWKLAASWKAEAQRRRTITLTDPVADTVAFCATALEATAELVENTTPTFTTGQYATVHHVRGGTVRKWIEAGELEAHKNAAGDWEIPRGAGRTRKPKEATS